MAKISIRHLIKRGNTFYWQPSTKLRNAGWKCIKLGSDRQTAIAKAEEQNELIDKWRAGTAINSPVMDIKIKKTVESLIAAYLASQEFNAKAPKTQDGYRYNLRFIAKWANDVPLDQITRPSVRDLYVKLCNKISQRVGYGVIGMLRLLLQFAVDEGKWGLEFNVASKPMASKPKARDEKWEQDEFLHMVKTADEMGLKSIGTAMYLGIYLGQREMDLLNLNCNSYINGKFRLCQGKTKRWIMVKAHKDLCDRLKSIKMEVGQPIIRAEFNDEPLKQSYFTHNFAKIRNKAAETMPNVTRLNFQDLRRTAVVRLAEAGCTETEISAVTGHKIETCREILETYCPRTEIMADNAINKLEKVG